MYDDLKEMLKQKNLKQSGKKEELIDRLLNCNMDELLRKYTVVKLYRCSETGNRLVKEFVEKENRKREENERLVIKCLRKGEFKEAIREVVKFEASQIIPRGMGIDWQNYKLEKVDLEMLTAIFKSRPKILTLRY
jgi:Glu-tRNA(Gln) amidotransferase subunit E-like FAD-binding protein